MSRDDAEDEDDDDDSPSDHLQHWNDCWDGAEVVEEDGMGPCVGMHRGKFR